MNQDLYIIWNDKNNTGVPIIDEQHKCIVGIINSLHYFIREGLGKEAVRHTLNILEQYV